MQLSLHTHHSSLIKKKQSSFAYSNSKYHKLKFYTSNIPENSILNNKYIEIIILKLLSQCKIIVFNNLCIQPFLI